MTINGQLQHLAISYNN